MGGAGGAWYSRPCTTARAPLIPRCSPGSCARTLRLHAYVSLYVVWWQLLFAALDRSGDSCIDEAEFLSVCEVLRVRFERVPRRNWLEARAPWFAQTACWQRISALVRSRLFDSVVDALLVFAGVILVIEERQVLSGRPQDFDSRPDSLWNLLELVLSVFFMIEMALKLLALGWREYTRSLKNELDAVVSLATFVVVIIVYVPNAVSDARIIRLTLLLRLLRLLRVLDNLSIVRFVSSTFVATLPEARKLGRMMFVVVYFFSALGLELFGGKINTDPGQPEPALLANTSFASSDYYPMNYNDLASGFVTCFSLVRARSRGAPPPPCLLSSPSAGARVSAPARWCAIAHVADCMGLGWCCSGMAPSQLPVDASHRVTRIPHAQLIINNWYVLCDAFVVVTSPWARLYFVAFYAVGPLVCLNVSVAFCVEAFLAVMEDAKVEAAAVANGYVQDGEHGCTHFDAAEVSGTQTGLEGTWRATMTAGPLPSRPNHHRSAILRSLLGSAGTARAP